jgi:opacity protein-like surface antigen
MDVISSEILTWTVAADALRPSDNVETVNVGTQVGWGDMLFLRAGLRGIGQDEREEGVSVGGGIRLGVGGLMTVEADYAYTQFGLFGNLNTLAVGVRF